MSPCARLAVPLFALAALAGCPSTDYLTSGARTDDDDSEGSSGPRTTSPTPSTGTGSTSSGSPPPVKVTNGRCDPSAPWGTPSVVTELSGGTQQLKPRLCVTKDELEIYYLRNDGGGVDGMPTLRHGKRSSVDDKWTVSTESAPDPPPADLASIVNDGTKLYYYVKISGVNVMHVSERTGKGFFFTTGVPVTIASGATTVGFVVETDDFIYFGDGSDMRRAFVSSSGFAYTGELALKGHSKIPIVNTDQTNLYFREYSAGSTTIFRAHRADTNAEFTGASVALTYPGIADVRWVSNDDCQMYLSGDDQTQVYEARRGN